MKMQRLDTSGRTLMELHVAARPGLEEILEAHESAVLAASDCHQSAPEFGSLLDAAADARETYLTTPAANVAELAVRIEHLADYLRHYVGVEEKLDFMDAIQRDVRALSH